MAAYSNNRNQMIDIEGSSSVNINLNQEPRQEMHMREMEESKKETVELKKKETVELKKKVKPNMKRKTVGNAPRSPLIVRKKVCIAKSPARFSNSSTGIAEEKDKISRASRILRKMQSITLASSLRNLFK